ncbi:hypothetical protein BGX23_004464, partial [Mortierella sp. AD031]
MRARKKEHAPPARMKQFIWKPPKEPPKAADDTDDNTRAKPKTGRSRTPSTSRSKSVDDMDKNQLVRSMVWEHPPAVLDVGTLAGNVKRVLSSEPNLQEEVVDTIQEASRLAADTKRKAQRLIGKYLETLRLENVSEMDREILDNLCERVKPKETSSNGSDEEADNVESEDASTELDGKGSTQFMFLSSFLKFLYSGNFPDDGKTGKSVNNLIRRLEEHQHQDEPLHPDEREPIFKLRRPRGTLNETMPYTPTDLVRSVASQLRVELKKIYRNGSHDLSDKLKALQEKGLLAEDTDYRIRSDVSAIENFLRLNRISNQSRRIVPLSTSEQPFVSFSERELISFFWKREPLKKKLLEMVQDDDPGAGTLADVQVWIRAKEPGHLIKRLICDVDPPGLTSRQRGKLGYRGAVKLLSLDQIATHLSNIQQPSFNPSNYREKGYVLRGSLRTDGYRIQLSAFKLKELQAIRFRRLEDGRLPPRLTTTV